jgi:tetratricopeptide (TPR) repeat protein
LHYAYGNIEFEEKLYVSARRSFESCLQIISFDNRTHPITAAAYYSLGCVEFEMGNTDPALGFLSKARHIAELRSPLRDDGTIARILWKISMVLRNQPSGMSVKEAKEADQILARAYLARSALTESGEAAEGEIYDLDRREAMSEMEREEESFDLLVPGYFR